MQEKIERLYYLDTMRCVLMILGVVLHSAQVFNPQKTWLIASQHSHEWAYVIVQVIHTFRMPAFFVLSGFFCVITLQKYQLKRFVFIRFKRIVIPIVAVALTFNLVQWLLLANINAKSVDIDQFFFNGGWVSHLWFLINLTVYLVLFLVIYMIMHTKVKLLIKCLLQAVDKLPLLVIFILLPFSSIFILTLNKLGFPLYSNFLGFIDVYSLMKYLPYFVFGLTLAVNVSLLNKFAQSKIYINVLLLFLGLACLENSEGISGFSKTIIDAYINSFIVWISIALVFNIFFILYNKYSKMWRFLSDASYSIYLFHHLFVVSIGLMLIYFDTPGLLGMAILITTTTILSLVIHKYLVCEVKVLRFMFNGK